MPILELINNNNAPASEAAWSSFWAAFETWRSHPNPQEFSRIVRPLLQAHGITGETLRNFFKADGAPSESFLEELTALAQLAEAPTINAPLFGKIASYVYAAPAHVAELALPAHDEEVPVTEEIPATKTTPVVLKKWTVKKWDLLYKAHISVWHAALSFGFIKYQDIALLVAYKNALITEGVSANYFGEISALEELAIQETPSLSRAEIEAISEKYPDLYHEIQSQWMTSFSLLVHMMVFSIHLLQGSTNNHTDIRGQYAALAKKLVAGTTLTIKSDVVDEHVAGETAKRGFQQFLDVLKGIKEEDQEKVRKMDIERIITSLRRTDISACSGLNAEEIYVILKNPDHAKVASKIKLKRPEITVHVQAPTPTSDNPIEQLQALQTALVHGRMGELGEQEKNTISDFVGKILINARPARTLHNELYDNNITEPRILDQIGLVIERIGYERWVTSAEDLHLLSIALRGSERYSNNLREWIASTAIISIQDQANLIRLIITMDDMVKTRRFLSRNRVSSSIIPLESNGATSNSISHYSDRIKKLIIGSVNERFYLNEMRKRSLNLRKDNNNNYIDSFKKTWLPPDEGFSEEGLAEIFEIAHNVRDLDYIARNFKDTYHLDLSKFTPQDFTNLYERNPNIFNIKTIINFINSHSEIPLTVKSDIVEGWLTKLKIFTITEKVKINLLNIEYGVVRLFKKHGANEDNFYIDTEGLAKYIQGEIPHYMVSEIAKWLSENQDKVTFLYENHRVNFLKLLKLIYDIRNYEGVKYSIIISNALSDKKYIYKIVTECFDYQTLLWPLGRKADEIKKYEKFIRKFYVEFMIKKIKKLPSGDGAIEIYIRKNPPLTQVANEDKKEYTRAALEVGDLSYLNSNYVRADIEQIETLPLQSLKWLISNHPDDISDNDIYRLIISIPETDKIKANIIINLLSERISNVLVDFESKGNRHEIYQITSILEKYCHPTPVSWHIDLGDSLGLVYSHIIPYLIFYPDDKVYKTLNAYFERGLTEDNDGKNKYLERANDYFFPNKPFYKGNSEQKRELVLFLQGIISHISNYLRKPDSRNHLLFSFLNKRDPSLTNSFLIFITNFIYKIQDNSFIFTKNQAKLIFYNLFNLLKNAEENNSQFYSILKNQLSTFKLYYESGFRDIIHHRIALETIVSGISTNSKKDQLYTDLLKSLTSLFGEVVLYLAEQKPAFSPSDSTHVDGVIKIHEIPRPDFEKIITLLETLERNLSTPSIYTKVDKLIEGLKYIYNTFGKEYLIGIEGPGNIPAQPVVLIPPLPTLTAPIAALV